MRFRVVINGVEVVREWSWDKILSVKEELKRMGFRWTGDGWVGRVRDPMQLYTLRTLLDLTDDELGRLQQTVQAPRGDVVMVVGEIPEKLRPYVVASYGASSVVSVSRFIRDFVSSDKTAIAQSQSYEDYVRRAAEEFRALLRGLDVRGDLKSAIDSAIEIALSSERLKSLYERRVAWRTVELGPTSAALNFASKELVDELRSFKLAYNIVGKNGEVKQTFIQLVKVSRDKEKIILKYPIFLRDKISEILKKYGYITKISDISYKKVSYRSSVRLLEFQRAALEAWIKSGYRGTVAVPTGGGKTFIGLGAMAETGEATLILAVTKELALQWIERVRKYLGVQAGLLGGGSHDVRDVTVAIYNSAVKYIDELMNRFGLVIFDEAHHVPAETFKEVALALDSPKRLALSATPKRDDGNELLIFEAVGPLVFRASYREMIEAGLVVPIEHYRVYVRLTPEEESKYKSAERSTDNAIVLRNIAAQASAKIQAAIDIIKREVSLGHKVIVFTQFLEQARAIYQRLTEHQIRAELITSEERDRDAAFARFASGLVRVVVTTTVLDEGVDVPDADVAVVVSGSGSKRQMIQRVGRIVRASQGKSVGRVYELVARGTIEEALSESRHVDDIVEESVCKRLSESALREFLSKTSLLEYK